MATNIAPQLVKELRELTGAGMMDCKNALVEANGDKEKAKQILREKGLAKAVKRAGRTTAEGAVVSYIHPGNRIGVLLELDCETDFVAKTDEFLHLAHEISMHIAAMSPLSVGPDQIPQDILDKEKEIFKKQAEDTGKPAQFIEKIVSGRVQKFYKENCLLKQEYTRDSKKTIEDVIKETIAKVGENITVRRFTRYEIGE